MIDGAATPVAGPARVLALEDGDAVEMIRGRGLEWVEIGDNLRFANWEGDGRVPEYVETRFPDR